MIAADYAIIIVMGVAAVIAAGSFSVIANYLFDRGLADRNHASADIRRFYKIYITQTKQASGRIGSAFWVHGVSVAIFILTGVIYTVVRMIVPRFL
jgi:hypothetical protein